MEVTVLVDGRPRIVSGVTENTTCRELVLSIARFRSQPGIYKLLLMRDSFNDGSRPVAPLFLDSDTKVLQELDNWRHQVAARPQLRFPASGCLVLVLQKPGEVNAHGQVAKRRRQILQLESKEQAARLRVVTRLAKQLEAENRSLLLEAESYGEESTSSPSKSLLADEFQRVSSEIKELEQAGLHDLLMQQRDTERSLRSAIERYRERMHDTEAQLNNMENKDQLLSTPKKQLINGHCNGGLFLLWITMKRIFNTCFLLFQ